MVDGLGFNIGRYLVETLDTVLETPHRSMNKWWNTTAYYEVNCGETLLNAVSLSKFYLFLREYDISEPLTLNDFELLFSFKIVFSKPKVAISLVCHFFFFQVSFSDAVVRIN